MTNVSLTSRANVFVLLLAFIVAPISSISAEQGKSGFPTVISMDISDGAIIDSNTVFDATISVDEYPNHASWKLVDTSGTRHFVEITEIFDSIDDEEPPLTRSFEIEISPDNIGPCSCILVVSITDLNSNVISESVSVFINPETVLDYDFPPTLQIDAPETDAWHRGLQSFESLTTTIDGKEPIFFTYLQESPSVKCTYVTIVESHEGISDSSEIESINSNLSNIYWEDGKLHFSIDLVEYSDGWYDLVVIVFDSNNDALSHDCISIRLDNNSPIPIINGPEVISEGLSSTTFDATSSYDDVWGIQDLTYVWSVNKIGTVSDWETQVLAGSDARYFSIEPEESGIYQIRLTVSDSAGNVAHTIHNIEVLNLPPLVRLEIDGLQFTDQEEFPLSRGTSCVIDASKSSDTPNDMESLRYIWRVNNIPTYEGPSRELTWPDGIDGRFILSIEVIDDNSQSSMISVIIHDPDTNYEFPPSLIAFIISGVFLTYSIIRYRTKINDAEIPKWR